MKALIINCVCGIRSTGRICTDLAQRLSKDGYEVKIAYGRVEYVPDSYKSMAVRIGNDLDLKLHALQTRLFDTHGFGSRRATKKFLEWADRYKPDLLWLHNIHGYYINVEMLFTWIKKHPEMQVKWTLHDCWAFTGHCAYFSMAQCDEWKTGCATHCPQLRNYPTCLFIGNTENNFKRKMRAFMGVKNLTLITPSKWLADLTRQSFLKVYPVEVQYNTIDTSIFKPTESDFRKRYNLQDKIIILGVASVWDARKGLSDFYKLAQMLDENYAIVLVGLSKKQIRKMPKNITGIQRTNSPQELAAIYTAANVFVNPTYEDNYPTVNLEAQACGTRVITYDAGGSMETIKTQNSCAIETGNVIEMKGKIDEIENV